MSTFQRLTLIGLYNHYPALFSKLTLPTAYNADTFIDSLLLDQGEKRVAYPEPEFMEYAIGVWCRKWAAALERIALALNSEYNPIHNYDRYEEWTDHTEGEYNNALRNDGTDTTRQTGTVETETTNDATLRGTGTITTDHTGTVTTKNTGTTTETTNNMTTERTVSAFNESTYQPDEKSVINGSVTTTPNTTETQTINTQDAEIRNTTDTETRTGDEVVTRNLADVTERNSTENGTGDDIRDTTHNGHLYGNIGVTTSQQMIQAEIDLRSNQNMYSIAAQIFADDLLLMLY